MSPELHLVVAATRASYDYWTRQLPDLADLSPRPRYVSRADQLRGLGAGATVHVVPDARIWRPRQWLPIGEELGRVELKGVRVVHH